MNLPKICFVAQTAYPVLKEDAQLAFIGGAELQQVLIGKALQRRGYHVSFITMDHGQGQREKRDNFVIFATFKPKEGIPVLRFFYPRLVKIWRALKASNADIYYVRTADFILAPVVYFARSRGKKVVFCGANDPNFDPQNLRMPTWRDKMLYFWGLRRADAIVVQNRHQQNTLKENFQRKGRRIYNGFPARSGKPEKGKHILWVANIKPHKVPQRFVELARQFPDEPFVMIGGPSGSRTTNGHFLFQEIKAEAAKITNLNCTGFLPFEATEAYFQQAKLFINTSLHEGFPNTLLQAWSRGIPVFSFVDPDGLIEKNELGVVVKSTAELVEKTYAFLSGELVFSREKIQAFFERHLTIEAITEQYTTLFSELMENQYSSGQEGE